MSQACAVCACVALLQVYSLAYYEAALTAAADQRPPLLLRGASTSGGAGEAAGAASEGEEAALFGAGDAGDALSELGYRGGVSIPKVFHQSWRDDGFPKDLFNWRWQAVHRPSLLPPPSSLRSPLRQHLSSRRFIQLQRLTPPMAALLFLSSSHQFSVLSPLSLDGGRPGWCGSTRSGG